MKIKYKNLKDVQEKIMKLAREKRASATAKAEGLQNRKKDLLEHIENDLKLNESNLFNSSNLPGMRNFFQMPLNKKKLWMQKREKETNLVQ